MSSGPAKAAETLRGSGQLMITRRLEEAGRGNDPRDFVENGMECTSLQGLPAQPGLPLWDYRCASPHPGSTDYILL